MQKKYIGLLAVLFILLFHLLGIIYFNNRFLPKTIINGKDYGTKTVQGATKQIQDEAASSVVHLKSSKKEDKLELKNIKYEETVSEYDLQNVLVSQSALLWEFSFFSENKNKVPVETKYSSELLDKEISRLVDTFNGTAKSKNAEIVRDENGKFEIKKEIYGDIIDVSKFKSLIVSSIENKESDISLDSSNAFISPEILSTNSDLVARYEKLKAYDGVQIVYDFKDRKEELSPEVFSDWISVKSGEVVIDRKAARKYLANLAKKYDTFQTDRTFKRIDGKEIKIGGGIYGWQIAVDKTTDELIETLKSGESKILEPVYRIKGFERATDDIGKTYVEVDLTKQKMWYFKDGKKIIETDIVSGLPGGGRETPTGVFNVWSKEKNRYLTGPGYKVKVQYWMPIDWTGVGLHDAYWQSAFGGNRYTYAGSNGCLNTPLSNMKKFYDSVDVGTPVVVYKS